MRKTLENLIKSSILLQYTLPCTVRGCNKTVHSTENDHCYSPDDSANLVPIIYNGIVDYSFNEVNIDISRLSQLHIRALKTKLRYNESQTIAAKQKYGFYGEVMLFLMLQVLYGVDTLISRGYFYNPLESSETKGYDTYQLVQKPDNSIELWFGEVKFYQSYKAALRKVFDNIEKALSDDYLETNVLAMSDKPFNAQNTAIETILKAWEDNPSIKIIDEIRNRNIALVYPILVMFEKGDEAYDDVIKEVVDHINTEYTTKAYSLSVPIKVFFMLLPVDGVGNIKQEVIRWIDTNQPLI